MDFHRAPWGKISIFTIELLLIVNVVLVDYWAFNKIHEQPAPTALVTAIPEITPQPISPLAITPTPTPIISAQPTTVTETTTPTFTVKDYYVPFGSGQSQASDWQDIPGLQAYINTTSYPTRITAVFEVTITVPNANQIVYARLFDVTDQHPVWYSDVSAQAGQPQLLISQPINLDKGNKLYQVQMKTQLQGLAILNQSRVHITIN